VGRADHSHNIFISEVRNLKPSEMTGSGMSPCAACKLLRRRCTRDCVFAPYFPPDEPQKFANVHKVFGAANVNKMLQVWQLDLFITTCTLATLS
jgi:hypothetical protein